MIRYLVILTGGKSSRMGTDKAMLKIGDETFLEHLVNKFSPYFEQVVLSVNQPGKYNHLKLPNREVVDIYSDIGPLGGIYSVLKQLEAEEIFVLSVDMPFASPELALEILNNEPKSDISVIQRENGKNEPLFAKYAKSCLPYIEQMIMKKDYKLNNLFDQVNTSYIYKEETQLEKLANLNTKEEYTKLIH